jgi:hypothetical protein
MRDNIGILGVNYWYSVVAIDEDEAFGRVYRSNKISNNDNHQWYK